MGFGWVWPFVFANAFNSMSLVMAWSTRVAEGGSDIFCKNSRGSPKFGSSKMERSRSSNLQGDRRKRLKMNVQKIGVPSWGAPSCKDDKRLSHIGVHIESSYLCKVPCASFSFLPAVLYLRLCMRLQALEAFPADEAYNFLG